MKKRNLSAALAAAMALSLAACGGSQTAATTTAAQTEAVTEAAASESAEETTAAETEAGAEAENAEWDAIVEKAKGTEVTFYGWGGDENLNRWLDDVFALAMKEKYDITMNRVPMDIDQVLSQLAGEVQAGDNNGDIDMIWINGENFKSAKENDFLYGPFTDQLPNYNAYIDTTSEDNTTDFAYPIDGYEAPYGKAQLVMFSDTEAAPEQPKNAEEFLQYVQKYPGKVTYPALPDFTGSAFVRNIIYETCGGYEQFMTMEADKETVKAAIQPAIDYLKSLNPYLWNEGKTFPDSSTTLDKMFQDGEVIWNVSYDAFAAATGLEEGIYPAGTQTFLFDNGMIGNTNFMAIAKSSGNPEGAMVAVNEMESPEMQASRYQVLKTVPVLDYTKLPDEAKAEFDNVDLGEGIVPQSELVAKRLPEMPAGLVPVIEEIWSEEVVGK
ncbi:MAG: ABC transporter substrate-binding protein [Eubacteriales bacterium]|nr:ABC transporter substrate-binding protein [Eubacteriales bacterium]